MLSTTLDNCCIKPRECHQCHVQGKPLSQCGRCQLVEYCSKECQTQAWKTHKAVCQKNPSFSINGSLYKIEDWDTDDYLPIFRIPVTPANTAGFRPIPSWQVLLEAGQISEEEAMRRKDSLEDGSSPLQGFLRPYYIEMKAGGRVYDFTTRQPKLVFLSPHCNLKKIAADPSIPYKFVPVYMRRIDGKPVPKEGTADAPT